MIKKLWTIPLTYAVQDEDFKSTSTKIWMTERNITIPKPNNKNKWIIFNVQRVVSEHFSYLLCRHTGFYRVNYDESNWNLLIKYLKTPLFVLIPPVNRAQIIDDAAALVLAGVLKFNTTFHLLNYLKQETDYIVWEVATKVCMEFYLRLVGTGAFSYFKDFMKLLIEKVYETLGFHPKIDDSHTTKVLRSKIVHIACSVGYEDCRTSAKELFKEGGNIPADLHKAVYCTVVSDGSVEEWNTVEKLYNTSNNMIHKITLLEFPFMLH